MDDRRGIEFARKSLDQHLDVAEVLAALIKGFGREEEKRLLLDTLGRLSYHQIEGLEMLRDIHPNVVEQVTPFFLERVDAYRKALRFSKLFSFRSWVSIEEEASQKAWQDTLRMLRETSFLESHIVRNMFAERRAVMESICQELVGLVRSSGPQEQVDFESLRSSPFMERLQALLEDTTGARRP